MAYYGKGAIKGIDYKEESRVFDRTLLEPFTVCELNKIYKRNIESAFHGNFWAFQVCNSIAARLVALKSADLMAA